jgi:plasmid stabilization system protein ParE
VTRIDWTDAALSDLERLYDFLAPVNPPAAARTVQALVAAPERLLDHPRLGEPLDEFGPREVRRLIVGRYELRYEVDAETLSILRVFHAREDR